MVKISHNNSALRQQLKLTIGTLPITKSENFLVRDSRNGWSTMVHIFLFTQNLHYF